MFCRCVWLPASPVKASVLANTNEHSIVFTHTKAGATASGLCVWYFVDVGWLRSSALHQGTTFLLSGIDMVCQPIHMLKHCKPDIHRGRAYGMHWIMQLSPHGWTSVSRPFAALLSCPSAGALEAVKAQRSLRPVKRGLHRRAQQSVEPDTSFCMVVTPFPMVPDAFACSAVYRYF